MATYSIGDFDRREILTMLAVLTTSALMPARFAAAQYGTPADARPDSRPVLSAETDGRDRRSDEGARPT